MRKQAKTKRAKLTRTCDDLWRKKVKELANGICEWCKKTGSDAHHMVGRRRSMFLRHRLENGVFVCCSCHYNFHNHESLTGWEKFKRDRPDDCEFVEQYMHKPIKIKDTDLEESAKRLSNESI